VSHGAAVRFAPQCRQFLDRSFKQYLICSSGVKHVRELNLAITSGVPRKFFRGGVSTNSVEDRGQREGDLGAVAP
jgi:hypothetical protein